MRTRLLVCVLAALAASCVKRVAPSPGDTRTTLSGFVVVRRPQEMPEGTQVAWSFGDGTPDQQGPAVDHVFPGRRLYGVETTGQGRPVPRRPHPRHLLAPHRADGGAGGGPRRAVGAHAVGAGSPCTATWPRSSRSAPSSTRCPPWSARARGSTCSTPRQPIPTALSRQGSRLLHRPADPEALVFAIGTSTTPRRSPPPQAPRQRESGGPLRRRRVQLSIPTLPDGYAGLLGQTPRATRSACCRRSAIST